MNWLKNMNIGTRLLTGFAATTVLTAIVGILGVRGMGVCMHAQDVTYASAHSTILIDAAILDLRRMEATLDNAVMDGTAAEVRTQVEATRLQGEQFSTALDEYEKSIDMDVAKDKFREVRKAYPVVMEAQGEILRLAVEQGHEAAIAKRTQSRQGVEALAGLLGELRDFEVKDIEAMNTQSDAAMTAARTTIIAFLVLALLIASAIGFLLARAISGPLHDIVEAVTLAATGDLTVRAAVNSRDEVGQAAEQLNVMMQNFEENMRQVASASHAITTASSELSAASQSISSGAQEQASSLEETAASLEEMTSAVKQTADNAQQAAQLARGAREVAEKGGKVVGSAVEAMREINASSRKIADIITAIDEIAFQTNLLALNAAVEAARAGEQGRGFAVVAGEVRNLAQRSASAAKEIKGLINDSVERVESGSKLVDQSGATLEEIVTSVKRVTDIVAEIAASSREQSTGIEQVNTAVTQMDAVTQSNASQTEELAGTAEGLSGQAQTMMTLVQRFKLGDSGHSVPQASPARPKMRGKVLPMHKAGARATKQASPGGGSGAAAATGTDGFEEF